MPSIVLAVEYLGLDTVRARARVRVRVRVRARARARAKVRVRVRARVRTRVSAAPPGRTTRRQGRSPWCRPP